MKKITMLMLTLAMCIIAGSVSAQRITVTGVGNGVTGFNGDGLPAVQTELNGPYDVCLDAAHNVYFTDQVNGRVRKVSAATGIVTTIAGGGSSSAEGVPALTAAVNPYFMCIDAAGNVYFSEPGRIRKINAATGTITTIAGTGTAGYSGDGGPATAAMIQGQLGICVDAAGNVYLADGPNQRIRKVTAATGIISTVAGTGTAGYTGDGSAASAATVSFPTVICVDDAGNLYFADQSDVTGGTITFTSTNYIREINGATGVITTIAGTATLTTLFDCAGTDAYLGCITGICVDHSGRLYCNEISCSCRCLDLSTGYMSPVAGSFYVESFDGDGGGSLGTWMAFPYGLCADPAGNVYIADNFNDRIRTIIQEAHAPLFAFGHGQSVGVCAAVNLSLAAQLTTTDLDSAHTETFTVLSAPAHGTLAGFPYAMLSTGQDTVSIPSGLSYTANAGFAGTDNFRVVVSDGSSSDTVTLYADVTSAAPGAITDLPASVCMGHAITITSDSAAGVWSVDNANATLTPGTGSAVLDPITAGTVTVTYSNTNTCGTGSVTQTITIDAMPEAGTISGLSDVNEGATIVLSDPATGGTWSSVNTAIASVSPAGVVSGISAGIDGIVYAITNACGTSTAAWVVNVHVSATGINNVNGISTSLTVSPNPAHGQFNVNIASSYDEQATITITNVAGGQVKQFTGATNTNISTELDVPAGMYLLQAATAHGNMSSKVVME